MQIQKKHNMEVSQNRGVYWYTPDDPFQWDSITVQLLGVPPSLAAKVQPEECTYTSHSSQGKEDPVAMGHTLLWRLGHEIVRQPLDLWIQIARYGDYVLSQVGIPSAKKSSEDGAFLEKMSPFLFGGGPTITYVSYVCHNGCGRGDPEAAVRGPCHRFS